MNILNNYDVTHYDVGGVQAPWLWYDTATLDGAVAPWANAPLGSIYILIGASTVTMYVRYSLAVATTSWQSLVPAASTGYVGIGTVAPSYPLSVVTSAASPMGLTRTGVGTYTFTLTNRMSGSVADLLFSANQASSGYLFETINASAAAVVALGIDRNGNVGIGTVAPSYPFSVVTDAASPMGLTRTGVGTYTFTMTNRMSGSAADLLLSANQASSGYLFQTINASSVAVAALGIDRNGNVGIGTVAPTTVLHALVTSAVTDAVTNAFTFGHDSSGTPAAGFGAGQLITLQSSTTVAQAAARIQALWFEATHASRKADLVLTAYDTAEREGLRIRGNGTVPAIGFLGATPVARAAHIADATDAPSALTRINAILVVLENLGLVAAS